MNTVVHSGFHSVKGTGEWMLANFNLLEAKPGHSVYESPVLSIAGHNWQFSIYPGGEKKVKRGKWEDIDPYVSIFLACEDKVNGTMEVGVRKPDGTERVRQMTALCKWSPDYATE